MRLLIIGGTGLISAELTRQASSAGHNVTVINRGRSGGRVPVGVHTIVADATDATAMRAAMHGMRLRGERFDAVVQCVAYRPEHVAEDVETFAAVADQYMLIATSAAYQTFDRLRPLTEDTPQHNAFWEYARLKAECEEVLRDRAAAAGLGFTIVRPAHTYGDSKIPGYVGNSAHPWTLVDRMRRGADIIIPGDGTSLWTLTHASDVASGMLNLLGNPGALGRAVHITGSEAYTWMGIHAAIARAAGISDEDFAAQVVCVPTDGILAAAPDLEGGTRGDKMHPAVYDTSLLRSLAPDWSAQVSLDQGLSQAISWFEEDPARQSIDARSNALLDRLGAVYRGALDQLARPES